MERGKWIGRTRRPSYLLRKKELISEDLDATALAYTAGVKIAHVCNKYSGIPEQTIRHRSNLCNRGVTLRKPGPPPILREKMECDLLGWVVGMQKNGLLYNREAWLEKANVIYWAKYGIKRSTGFLTLRWVS